MGNIKDLALTRIGGQNDRMTDWTKIKYKSCTYSAKTKIMIVLFPNPGSN